MKPYPAYKDSGVEWFPEIPEHWDVWKMSHAVPVISSGTTPNTEKHDNYDNGVIPWINTGDLNDDLIEDCAKRVTELAIKQLSSLRIYPAGSVVIALYGATIGKLGIINVPACVNQACCVLSEFSAAADARFLFYWLLGFRGRIVNLASGGGQPNISQEIVRSLRLPLPPLPEQQAIAAFLDRETAKIDGLIEEQRRLIALLAEKRQATISHAVTRGLNPSARLKPSGVDWLGDVPEGWEVVPTGYRYEVQLGRMLNEERATGENMRPYLRVLDVQWGQINTDDLPLMDFPLDAQERYRLEPGDLMVNEGGSYVGRSAIWRGEIDECYYQKALHRLRPREPRRDSAEFFYFVMDMATRRKVFVAGANQTTIDHLTAEQLRAHRFAFPPMGEQIAIAEHLGRMLPSIDALTETATAAVALLQERRAALISAAVTGKIDVREVQASPVQIRKSLSVSVLLGGVIIAALGRHASMGRMLVQKHLFMAEAHAGVSELQGRYDRQAAGPYDAALQRGVEADLVAAGLLRVAQDGGPGSRVEYEFLGDAAVLRADLAVALGDRMARFDDTFRQLADLSKPGIEAVATLYAAWNDFLMDGKNPSRDDIIREVLENWHDEKRDKFTKSDLAIWLDWMDRHQIQPKGTGPKTQTGRLFP